MVDEELKELLNAMRDEFLGELRNETSALRHEMRHEFAAVRQENAMMHVETRRHFDMALEATRHEIQLVAERASSISTRS